MNKVLLSVFCCACILSSLYSCSKNSGDSNTYTCTCHYNDFRLGKDTILVETYPPNTDKSTAQSRCDSNKVNLEVIDPNTSCSL